MTIVSACKLGTSGKKTQYYVVFEPAYAGAYPQDAILIMDILDFEIYQPDVKMFDTCDEADKYAYDQAFGPDAWPDSWTEEE